MLVAEKGERRSYCDQEETCISHIGALAVAKGIERSERTKKIGGK